MSAAEQTIRCPREGYPAVLLKVPDDWTYSESMGSAMVTGKSLALVWTTSGVMEGDIDRTAAWFFPRNGALHKGKPVTVSGWPGFTYDSEVTGDDGKLLQQHLVLVAEPSHLYVAILLVLPASLDAPQVAIAHGVQDSAQIIPALGR